MGTRKCHNCLTVDILDEHGQCTVCRPMRNKAMARKLARGEAIDLKDAPRTPEGDYILTSYIDGKDYCDSRLEAWIWSIGKIGVRTLAATTAKFYQREGCETLWLR